MYVERLRYLISDLVLHLCFFFFKQKTAYEMRISDWSSDVCSSDLKIVSWGSGQALAAAVIPLVDRAAGEGADGAADDGADGPVAAAGDFVAGEEIGRAHV